MPAFDAYHQWLGIPPGEQPPNHYRLLGVPLFESDPDVIETAAQRQTVFLRTLQLGPQAELAERTLNEVARARVTLLNVDQKAAYDDKLRQSQRLLSTTTQAPPADILSAEVDHLRETLKQRDRQLQERNQGLEHERAELAHQQQRLTRGVAALKKEREQQQAQPPRRHLPPARSAGSKSLLSRITDWTLSNAVKIAIVVILGGFLFLTLFLASDLLKEPELSVTSDLSEVQPKAAEDQPADRKEVAETTADQAPVVPTPSKPDATGPTVVEPEPVPPKVSTDEPDVVAVIQEIMTPEQKALGDPIVNSVGVVLVPIPAGQFQMGSPESEPDRRDDERQHLVQITKPFYLSTYEVTQQQYEQVMDANRSRSIGANKPVEQVSWNDAVAFAIS